MKIKDAIPESYGVSLLDTSKVRLERSLTLRDCIGFMKRIERRIPELDS